MWRSVLAVCLFVLTGVLTVSGTGVAVTAEPHVAAQPTETLAPGGTIEPGGAVQPGPATEAPKEQPASNSETRRKLWVGGIALLLFALVYWRNKKRWAKWKAGRKSG
ncbi:MAG: hypothetical protein HOV94_34975 [Saccharothrix sp.]|nr:hypothetical protein [Saccharothrix sp.]